MRSVNRPDPAASKTLPAYASLLVLGVALLARFVALRYTTLDSGDSVSRVLLGWLWSEDPFFMTSGGWGPLHFYLIGAVMRFWSDPIWAPAALHMVCGALTAPVICRLALELFGNARAAVFAGLAFAIYPMAVMSSTEAHAEVIFGLFLALSLLYLVRAWGAEGRVADAVIAGLSITLGSMLRYEAWMLLPFLVLPLWPRRKLMFAFLAAAMIHPLIWMTGSAIELGNPLYSFIWSSNFERETMGHKSMAGVALGVQQLWQLIMTTVHGLSLPLTLLIMAGVLWCLLRRKRESFWLLPSFGLFALLTFAASRGSLWVKPTYTLTFGVMLVPFVAACFSALHVERWTRGGFVAAVFAMLGVVSVTTVEPLWIDVPHGAFIYSRAHGEFAEDNNVDEILDLVSKGGGLKGEALVSDFIGWQPTGYVIERTRVSPGQLCIPNGAPVPVDAAAIQNFLRVHRRGTLIAYTGGKLTRLLERRADGTASLAGVPLRLAVVGSVEWPGSSDTTDVGPGTIEVSRFEVLGLPLDIAPRGASCPVNCPISFCRT